MIGRKKEIIENDKGDKLKVEYGMLDSGDSGKAFFFLFGMSFTFLFFMASIMVGSISMGLITSIIFIICLAGTISSAMKKKVTKLSKREFRDEQIDDLIG